MPNKNSPSENIGGFPGCLPTRCCTFGNSNTLFTYVKQKVLKAKGQIRATCGPSGADCSCVGVLPSKNYFMCLGVLPVCMCMHHLCAWFSRPEEGVRSPGTRISEPPCGYWESNLGSLEERPVLANIEPSPSPACSSVFSGIWCSWVYMESFQTGLLNLVSHT